MTNKVQKIREEVVRLREQLQNKVEESDFISGEVFIINYFLTFIDSLQEEPVSEGKDIFDNCLKSEEKFILPQKISGNINCENCLYSSACALGDIQACIIDKPVSEDLEMEALLYYPKMSRISESHGIIPADNESHYLGDANEDKRKAFIVGAKWKEKEMQSTIELAEDHAMLAGMEKMKEEMMKNAVDGVVHHFEKCGVASVHYNDPTGVPMAYFTSPEGLSAGDKVKIIVIKEAKI